MTAWSSGATDADPPWFRPVETPAGARALIAIGRGAGGGVKARRRNGRRLLARAQAALGLPPLAAGRDGFGAPVWPAGQRGSLSHWRAFSLCLLARGEAFDFGADLEGFADPEARAAIRSEALDATEVALLGAAGLPEGMAEALAFSAKEAFYKAAFPRLRRRIGFDAVMIGAPPAGGRIALGIPRGLGPGLPAGGRLDLGYAVFGRAVVTWLALPV